MPSQGLGSNRFSLLSCFYESFTTGDKFSIVYTGPGAQFSGGAFGLRQIYASAKRQSGVYTGARMLGRTPVRRESARGSAFREHVCGSV